MSIEDEGFSLGAEMAAFGTELDSAMLPEGVYDLITVKAVPKLSGGGKPAIVFTWHVVGGDKDGRTVVEQNTWSSDNATAARMFSQKLAKLGATQAWIKAEPRPSLQQIADRCIGTKVRASLTQDKAWDRNRVQITQTLQLGPAASGQTVPGQVPAEAVGVPAGTVALGADLGADGLGDDIWQVTQS